MSCDDELLKKSDFDKLLRLVEEANKHINKTNKTYYFTCPNCGSEAYCGESSNGHLHVRCVNCDIAMVQ